MGVVADSIDAHSTRSKTFHEPIPFRLKLCSVSPRFPSSNNAEERPTSVRYAVLGFLAAMTFVLYLDRVCISKAGPRIQEELGISNTAMGFVFAAFTLSYGLFEIPTGRWGDRYGSRGVLTRIVIWWSVFTALTGAAGGFLMLLLVRFLFGAGEAGALPNSARVLREWFPESSRGWAQGLVTTAMMVGGAAAPMASQALIDSVGWRWSFGVFGIIGLVWAAAFYLWFRDNPADHPATNQAERQLIAEGKIPPRKRCPSIPKSWLQTLPSTWGRPSGPRAHTMEGRARQCQRLAPRWCHDDNVWNLLYAHFLVSHIPGKRPVAPRRFSLAGWRLLSWGRGHLGAFSAAG